MDDFSRVDLSCVPVGSVVFVPVKQLMAHPYNKELYDDIADDNIETIGLVASIKDIGIREPLKVMANSRVLSGHRRLKCATLAGLSTVPCIVDHDVQTEGMAKLVLITHNVHQRKKTNIEIAREITAYAELVIGVYNSGRERRNKHLEDRIAEARALPEEEQQRLRDEIKAARDTLGLASFDSYAVAAYRFGMSKNNVTDQARIIRVLKKLRDEGNTIHANGLLAALNQSIHAGVAYVKKHNLSIDSKYTGRRTPRKARSTCEKMVATMQACLVTMRPLLDPDGVLVADRIGKEMNRLPLYVKPDEFLTQSDARELQDMKESLEDDADIPPLVVRF